MTDASTHQQSSTLRFRREVADRFGVLPNFFCSADAAPGLIEELWKFAKSAYLDSPLPSLFKERLFVHLSRFCEIRYCIVRHVGFLIGQGRPAGDADAGLETVEQVIEMLRRPLPEGPALTNVLERLERVSLGGRLPEPRTECETDLFDALTIMFLSPRDMRPRPRSCPRGGWRRHVRAPGGLSRLHSHGSLLDRDAPGADL